MANRSAPPPVPGSEPAPPPVPEEGGQGPSPWARGGEAEPEAEGSDPNTFPCANCGALLKFQPGTDAIVCEYCGHSNPIAENEQTIEELPFEAALASGHAQDEMVDVQTVKCQSCAAEFTLDPKVTSDECPFCGTQIVIEAQTHRLLKPRSLLPFRIDAREARSEFRKWVASRWFAPNQLKHYARADDAFTGMYVPYWTYDSQTDSRYTGMRGKYYYVTRTVTINGKTQTRMERRIRWTPVSGRVSRFFDDVLVLADDKLPRRYTENLEPWDLHDLKAYDDRYLAGFRAAAYGIDVRHGFEFAKDRMDRVIRGDVRRDIGGDAQRITSLSTRHSGVTYKHILLPVWVAAYRFQEKTYNIVVNGRTGEVQGERPWSWVKIALAVIGILALLTAAFLAYDYFTDAGMVFGDAGPLAGGAVELALAEPDAPEPPTSAPPTG